MEKDTCNLTYQVGLSNKPSWGQEEGKVDSESAQAVNSEGLGERWGWLDQNVACHGRSGKSYLGCPCA